MRRASSRRSAGSSTRRASQTVSRPRTTARTDHAERRHQQGRPEPAGEPVHHRAPRWRSGSANIVISARNSRSRTSRRLVDSPRTLSWGLLVVDRDDSCGWGAGSRTVIAARAVLRGRTPWYWSRAGPSGASTGAAGGHDGRRVHPVRRGRRSRHRGGDRWIAGAPGRSALPLGAADRARDARPGPAVLDAARRPARGRGARRLRRVERRGPRRRRGGTWRSRVCRSC